MDGLIMAAQLILSLTILVFIHELGHFMAAKAFGIKVEKFYIFFDAWGKKLFSFKRGETEYGIGWLPLGGYVKIAGMIDESMDKEALESEPQPWEFRSKPAWQRFIVMIGGIVMNVILGVIVYAFYLGFFEQEFIPVSSVNDNGGIYAAAGAQELGFETGDKILMVNGKEPLRWIDAVGPKVYFGSTVTVDREGEEINLQIPNDQFLSLSEQKMVPFIELRFTKVSVDSVFMEAPRKLGLKGGDNIVQVDDIAPENFSEFSEYLSSVKGDSVDLVVERSGEQVQLTLPIKHKVDGDTVNGIIGFYPDDEPVGYTREKYTFGLACKYGAKDAFDFIVINAIGLGKVFTGKLNARESIQSPVGIARFYGARWDWGRFWRMTAIISMILAFMNLLPIPALDGGHIVFLSWEMITRKPVNQKVLETAQVIGMVILLCLMVFAVGNDILRILGI